MTGDVDNIMLDTFISNIVKIMVTLKMIYSNQMII